MEGLISHSLSNFPIILFACEGAYANLKDDRGGKTIFGIASAAGNDNKKAYDYVMQAIPKSKNLRDLLDLIITGYSKLPAYEDRRLASFHQRAPYLLDFIRLYEIWGSPVRIIRRYIADAACSYLSDKSDVIDLDALRRLIDKPNNYCRDYAELLVDIDSTYPGFFVFLHHYFLDPEISLKFAADAYVVCVQGSGYKTHFEAGWIRRAIKPLRILRVITPEDMVPFQVSGLFTEEVRDHIGTNKFNYISARSSERFQAPIAKITPYNAGTIIGNHLYRYLGKPLCDAVDASKPAARVLINEAAKQTSRVTHARKYWA